MRSLWYPDINLFIASRWNTAIRRTRFIITVSFDLHSYSKTKQCAIFTETQKENFTSSTVQSPILNTQIQNLKLEFFRRLAPRV